MSRTSMLIDPLKYPNTNGELRNYCPTDHEDWYPSGNFSKNTLSSSQEELLEEEEELEEELEEDDDVSNKKSNNDSITDTSSWCYDKFDPCGLS